MPLQFQIQQAPFRTGIEEGEDPRALKLGTLTKCENLVWRKGGTLERRRGTSLVRSFDPRGYMIDLDGKIAYCIGSEVVDSSGGLIPGYLPRVEISSGAREMRPVRGVFGARAAASASSSIVVWSEGDPYADDFGSNLYAQITWPSGREAAVIPIAVGGYIPIDVWADGSSYWVVSQEDLTGGTLYLHEISAALNTLVSTVTMVTPVNGRAAARRCGDQIIAIYTYDTDSQTVCTVFDLAGSLVSSSNLQAATQSTNCIAYDAALSPDLVYLGWIHNELNFWGSVFTISTATASPKQVIHATIDATDAPITQVSMGVTAAGAIAAFDVNAVTGGLVTIPVDTSCVPDPTRLHVTFGVEMISAPIIIGSSQYIAAADNRYWGDGTRQSNAYLLRIPPEAVTLTAAVTAAYTSYPFVMIAGDPHDYAAKLAHADGSCFGLRSFPRAVPIETSTNGRVTKARFLVPFLVEPNNNMASLVGFRTWDISETDWTRSQGPIVKVGGDTVIRAGVLSVCDGSNVFDYGFGASPTLTEKLAAGGAVVAGTYISAVTYEFASKNLTYRSDLSNVFTMSTSGGNLTIEMAAMRIGPSNKQPANGVGYGDSAFPKLSIKSYRSTKDNSVLFERTIAPTYNMAISSLCQSADVFSDTRKDAEIEGGSGRHVDLSSRPGAYTNDGVLGDIQPPYFAIFTSSIGRLWGVQPGGREVWFSKRFDDDFSFAPGFVTAFRLQFDFEPTGLADLDDKIVIFGREKIAVVAGQGPTVTSGNNDFSPQYVQTDAGCTDPNSIATTPDGVIFRSVRGLMILTRGLTIERIGRPVQDLVDAYPLHISSALVAKDREVRLVLATEDGSDGVILVYNYEEKQWTTVRYPFVVKQILPIGDDVYLMSKDGDVYKESDTDACDAGAWTSPFFETAWISANGPIDFQAVRRFALMGQAFSDHHLHVEISFDYETEPYRVIEVDSLETLTMARELDDLQITIGKRRKCNAIRFLVRIDQPDAGEYSTSKGVSFSAMGIEVALKKGLRSRPKGIKR